MIRTELVSVSEDVEKTNLVEEIRSRIQLLVAAPEMHAAEKMDVLRQVLDVIENSKKE